MQVTSLRTLAPIAAFALSGCGDYPSWGETTDDRTYLPAQTDPLDQYDDLVVDWIDLEAEPNDVPSEAQQTTLALGSAAGVLDGTMNGLVWEDDFDPVVITDEACPSVTGSRKPDGVAGEYGADVDFYGITVESAGTLCVMGQHAPFQDPVGWDLVLFPLADGCQVPLAPVVGEGSNWQDGVLGFGRSGQVHAWSTHVEAGQRFALLVAGYGVDDGDTDTGTANRPLVDLPYQAAWALVADDGTNLAPCPRPSLGASE